MGQCILANGIEKISLIFILVSSLTKVGTAMTLMNIGVMTGGDFVGTPIDGCGR